MNGIAFTDFDGTLARTDSKFNLKDLETLNLLQSLKIVRVIATGRSLYSLKQMIPSTFPIDYVIFSSGAGIIHWATGKLIYEQCISAEDTERAANYLYTNEIPFTIHHPIPNNHYFDYFNDHPQNNDFVTRCSHYKEFAIKHDFSHYRFHKATQLLAISGTDHSQYDTIAKNLPFLKCIHTTSPQNNLNLWVEFFPLHVSKGHSAEWLYNHLQVNAPTMSIGNDFNDIDLLKWTKDSYLVSNAPIELLSDYKAFASNNENGFSLAINDWLHRIILST